ncbi:hypothetical protein [Natrinema sp. SYSU A 869]|uniref:hypothetical protein n=1 Tax=Natrinema sp. SYSU A 869 TaxID=2871694 RepID=UPI0021047ED8|nr:hypothetical protein [Natrinema sp. SYSU A 869]
MNPVEEQGGPAESSKEQINWSRKSFEDLQSFWNAHIEPDLARDGPNLDTRPTYEEITEAGYSGIARTLREHHDLTLSQFLATVGYPNPDSDADEDYDWGIDADTTIRELELYLNTYLDRSGHSDSTITSKRSRLARYVRTYADLYGSAPIVERVREDDVPPRDEKQRVRTVYDTFNDELSSPESKMKHATDVRVFYKWLEIDRDAPYNPALGAPQEEKWAKETPDDDDRDPPALDDTHVHAMVDVCESIDERLLIIATCAWGSGAVRSPHSRSTSSNRRTTRDASISTQRIRGSSSAMSERTDQGASRSSTASRHLPTAGNNSPIATNGTGICFRVRPLQAATALRIRSQLGSSGWPSVQASLCAKRRPLRSMAVGSGIGRTTTP